VRVTGYSLVHVAGYSLVRVGGYSLVRVGATAFCAWYAAGVARCSGQQAHPVLARCTKTTRAAGYTA
jgi:hypothetical protein